MSTDSDGEHLIPFTDEELRQLQTSLVSNMLELNKDISAGRVSESTATEQLHMLSQTCDKVSRFCKRKNGK